ncbi:site-2 protease family protein [bacterium]|nr:site-2 protease family protein [bacterium]
MNRKTIARHLILFILTIGTTFLIGSGEGIRAACMYSGALMSILLFHEMGHFLMARKYRVPATLPFFIPMPLPPFGTMGAVIKMKGNIPHRRALLDIGAAGPLAGLAVSIPVIYFGARLSTVVELQQLGDNVISLGDSFLFSWITKYAVGDLPEGKDLVLHPLAYAGWVGLLVTAMNLIPVGQLDGGHIVYALFQRKSRYVSLVIYGMMVYVLLFHSAMWLVWVILLAVFRKHPPTLYESLPLDNRRKIIGVLTLAVFVVTFTPAPFKEVEGLIPYIMKLLGAGT